MKAGRILKLWRRRWRQARGLGPLSPLLFLGWILLSLVFRLVACAWRLAFRRVSGSSTPGQPSRRRNHPPGFLKARAEAIERNIAYYGTQTCEVCYRNRSHGVQAFEVHHIRSWKRHPELRADPDNLAVTCFSCNRGMSDDYQSITLQRCERKHA